ncbi:hypothetical protein BMETH_216_0 [methanotrophic bacterial endosymbiont of Bathymodiolus sp.]|nr:hypothetical protein BMETH_216_0 [methanotrophic bacterial endosymbiont of Bathymodiolus sp.]
MEISQHFHIILRAITADLYNELIFYHKLGVETNA